MTPEEIANLTPFNSIVKEIRNIIRAEQKKYMKLEKRYRIARAIVLANYHRGKPK